VFSCYLAAALRLDKRDRAALVADTAASVSALFSKKGPKEVLGDYIEKLLSED
jgi:hypothetical protein